MNLEANGDSGYVSSKAEEDKREIYRYIDIEVAGLRRSVHTLLLSNAVLVVLLFIAVVLQMFA